MTEEASAVGWIVQVTISAPVMPPSPGAARWIGRDVSGAPTFKYFNVALAAPDKAVEATAKHLDRTIDDTRAVRKLSAGEVAALKLKVGEVRPA
jgi:hypothetical protein